MKSLILIAAMTVCSASAFARDFEKLAKDVVVNMYGRANDTVSVTQSANPNAFEISLSNGAEVGSAIYLVEITESTGVQAGEEVANIKVTYQGGN